MTESSQSDDTADWRISPCFTPKPTDRYRSLPLAAGHRVGTLSADGRHRAATGSPPAFAQNVAVVDVDVKEVAQGYRASELTGADVENGAGETIGSIDDLIVDREKVLFAILQIGGFLGIGGHLVAIPYDSLEISEEGATIVLAEASREELETLPEFEYDQE